MINATLASARQGPPVAGLTQRPTGRTARQGEPGKDGSLTQSQNLSFAVIVSEKREKREKDLQVSEIKTEQP